MSRITNSADVQTDSRADRPEEALHLSLSLFGCVVWFVHCSVTSHTRCFCLLGLIKVLCCNKTRSCCWAPPQTHNSPGCCAYVCVGVCFVFRHTNIYLSVCVWVCYRLFRPETGTFLGSCENICTHIIWSPQVVGPFPWSLNVGKISLHYP